MFDYLQGTVERLGASEVVLDVHGVGYLVHGTPRLLGGLPTAGESTRLYVHMHQLENEAPRLFGFANHLERQVFRLLIGVSKIGPAVALALLARFEAVDVVSIVAEDRAAELTQAKGVGKKTAERIVLELQDKFLQLSKEALPAAKSGAPLSSLESDLLRVLLGLDFNPRDARARARQLVESHPGEDLESLLRHAFEGL